MAVTARELFAPLGPTYDRYAYLLSFGQDARWRRFLVSRIEAGPGDRVLDVGAGSGWTTALLAHLVGETGVVLGLELEPAVAEFGAANLAGTGQPWATLEASVPGVLGDPARAPYDRILVSAEARTLPEDLVAQLTDDGRMVLPVRGLMTLVVR
ncbi:MAG: protein-L-isoaspartate O-methyltransferase family protein, partial [Acidimicrobiales bacterium]